MSYDALSSHLSSSSFLTSLLTPSSSLDQTILSSLSDLFKMSSEGPKSKKDQDKDGTTEDNGIGALYTDCDIEGLWAQIEEGNKIYLKTMIFLNLLTNVSQKIRKKQ